MKSDLNIPKVSGVEIAAVRRSDDDELWDIYLLNRNSFSLKNVLIASRGYGSKNGEDQSTSTLRHMIETLGPKSMAKIELIQKDVFHLTNQFWVSYYVNGEMYDKKFILLPDTILEKNISNIPDFNMQGVLHK